MYLRIPPTILLLSTLIQALCPIVAYADLALDTYDARMDLECFIRKQHITYAVPVKNETLHNCMVSIALKNTSGAIRKEVLEVLSHEEFVIQPHAQEQIDSVTLQTTTFYLNPKWHPKGRMYLVIEETENRFFLHTFFPFDFEAKPFSKKEFEKPTHSEEFIKWMKQYNNNLIFVNTILGKAWELNLKKIEEHRRNLYKKNNIAHLLTKDPLAIDRALNKIPLITHKIWVTSDKQPHALPEHNLNYLKKSIIPNPVSHGWKHYIWIESRKKLPEFAKEIDKIPDIILKEIKDIDKDFISGDLYKKAIKTGQFGKASDILRLEILLQYGGYYLDTDYELFQSLKPYSKVYDFVSAVEPMSAFLCNAFMGSRPGHPVLHAYLDLIIHNLANKDNEKNAGYKTIVETGPAMLTLAFALAGGHDTNVDIALPHMIIFPSKYNTYPCKPVVTPGWTMPSESIGAHYWETSWMNPKLGSKG